MFLILSVFSSFLRFCRAFQHKYVQLTQNWAQNSLSQNRWYNIMTFYMMRWMLRWNWKWKCIELRIFCGWLKRIYQIWCWFIHKFMEWLVCSMNRSVITWSWWIFQEITFCTYRNVLLIVYLVTQDKIVKKIHIFDGNEIINLDKNSIDVHAVR